MERLTPSRLGGLAGRLRAKAKELAERAEVAVRNTGEDRDDAMAERSVAPGSLGRPAPSAMVNSVVSPAGARSGGVGAGAGAGAVRMAGLENGDGSGSGSVVDDGGADSRSQMMSVEPVPRQRTDSQIMAAIDPRYFAEFDVVNHVLGSLPDFFDSESLDARIKEEDATLDVLNARLSDKVMKSYGDFVSAMARVRELGQNLTLTAILCKNTRSRLSEANNELTKHPLDIVKKEHRKQLLLGVIDTLESIHGISETEAKLQDAIDSGDFPAAIDLCLECRDAIGKLGEYDCVHEMAGNIHDKYSAIETRLDEALKSLTVSFGSALYERALVGYKLLGKTFVVMEKLQEYYLQAVKETTRQAVMSFIIRKGGAASMTAHRMRYSDLCQAIPEDMYLECLFAVLAACFDVLSTQHSMIMWHKAQSEDLAARGATEDRFLSDVSAGLSRFRMSLWDDLQQKVSVVLAQPDLSNMPVEELVLVFQAIEKLLKVGKAFCDSDGKQLRSALRRFGTVYLKGYQQQRLDDVRTMLENEMWGAMPVSRGFSMHDIHEVRDFLGAVQADAETPNGAVFFPSGGGGGGNLNVNVNPFRGNIPMTPKKAGADAGGGGVSLQLQLDVEGGAGVMGGVNDTDADIDEDVDEALKAEFIDEDGVTPSSNLKSPPPPPPRGRKPAHAGKGVGGPGTETAARFKASAMPQKPTHQKAKSGAGAGAGASVGAIASSGSGSGAASESPGPMVASATLNCVRLIGKYAQLMRSLPVVSDHLFAGMVQLFDVYFMSVFASFGSVNPGTLPDPSSVSPRLRSVISRWNQWAAAGAGVGGAGDARKQRLGAGGVSGAGGGGGGGGGESAPEAGSGSVARSRSGSGSAHVVPLPIAMGIKSMTKSKSKGSVQGVGMATAATGGAASTSVDGGGGGAAVKSSHSHQGGLGLNGMVIGSDSKLGSATGNGSGNGAASGSGAVDGLGGSSAGLGLGVDVALAGVSEMLELDDPVTLYGLRERACAAESVLFLTNVLVGLKPYLQSFIPGDPVSASLASQFYSLAVDSVNELRSCVYNVVALKSVNMEPFVGMIAGVNWATREVGTEHSAFVNSMLRDFQKFSSRLAEVGEGLSDEVKHGVWSHVIEHAMDQFVEGLASCKKCSNEGRALMSLDLKTLQMGLEGFTSLRPIPRTGVVDGYIKAFYLSDDELVRWFQIHPEYTLSQIVRLVNCGIGSAMKKKTRSELIHSLEEVDRSRQRQVVLSLDS